jgi:hypothetical protein
MRHAGGTHRWAGTMGYLASAPLWLRVLSGCRRSRRSVLHDVRGSTALTQPVAALPASAARTERVLPLARAADQHAGDRCSQSPVVVRCLPLACGPDVASSPPLASCRSGPVRSRTPSELRSSVTRNRIGRAGHGKADASLDPMLTTRFGGRDRNQGEHERSSGEREDARPDGRVMLVLLGDRECALQWNVERWATADSVTSA